MISKDITNQLNSGLDRIKFSIRKLDNKEQFDVTHDTCASYIHSGVVFFGCTKSSDTIVHFSGFISLLLTCRHKEILISQLQKDRYTFFVGNTYEGVIWTVYTGVFSSNSNEEYDRRKTKVKSYFESHHTEIITVKVKELRVDDGFILDTNHEYYLQSEFQTFPVADEIFSVHSDRKNTLSSSDVRESIKKVDSPESNSSPNHLQSVAERLANSQINRQLLPKSNSLDSPLIHSRSELNQTIGFFDMRRVSDWIEDAKQSPIPKMLFDSFWFEGELCILFAESGLGKSILAVQIADAISKGYAIKGFKLEATTQKVLLLDFELTKKQFEKRYSNDYTDHYIWSDNLYRIELNPDAADLPEGFRTVDEYIIHCFEEAIVSSGAKVAIIDNITYLKTDTESAKDAAPLMKGLQAIKRKHDLSLLILAHTPKRDSSKPITKNDVQGSARIGQFADSMFAIGASSRDSQLRYIKQVKVRAAEFTYDTNNVALCQVHKPRNFLMFEILDFAQEQEHLRQPSTKENNTVEEQVMSLIQQKRTQREIAQELGLSQAKVSRIAKKYQAEP